VVARTSPKYSQKELGSKSAINWSTKGRLPREMIFRDQFLYHGAHYMRIDQLNGGRI